MVNAGALDWPVTLPVAELVVPDGVGAVHGAGLHAPQQER
jgi:hypothetical protein